MEVGKHCCFPPCRRLDFLPFVCSSCGLVFCKEHCTPESHVCTQAAEGKESSVQTSTASWINKCLAIHNSTTSSTHPCSLGSCGRKDLVEFTCSHCGKIFCLVHRHQEDHSCTALQNESSKPVHAKGKEKKAISHSAASPTKGVRRGARSESTSAKVALMRMKMKAEGQDSVPQSERVYYEVQLPKEYGLPNKPMFFSKEWAVGRVIDFVAEKFKLRNENNKQCTQKLMLHSLDQKVLAMSKPLHTVLEIIPNGSLVILEYEGES